MAGKSAAVQKPLANVKGRTAFVTGGSSGIGLGIARALSAAGMKVIFTYKSAAHRDTALASFPKGNAGVHAILLDTTDREGMVRAADEAERVFGNVHLLCNNAGVGVPAQISSVSWQDWDWAMDVNVNGVFNGVRTFLPRMLKHGEGGHIVTTSSSGGIVAGTLGVYVTTKFAVVGLMESLRAEVAGKNIGVSVFCPGLVRTEIFDAERNRPASHGAVKQAHGGPPPLLPGSGPVDLMGVAMDPIEAGQHVLEGVRRNDLYILSHPEFAAAVRERMELLLASFSRKAVPEGRRLVTQTFTPDIYVAELKKKGLKVPGEATASRTRTKKAKSRSKPKRKSVSARRRAPARKR
ncbi:MAG TPA: SDR family NAD(P)-dependent oxidoreductase [Steroidobacteraceae bacterium]|nr:SDR family NAD(P)-dependent oxidoreductase [Steroidobacteraceae bacterium]